MRSEKRNNFEFFIVCDVVRSKYHLQREESYQYSKSFIEIFHITFIIEHTCALFMCIQLTGPTVFIITHNTMNLNVIVRLGTWSVWYTQVESVTIIRAMLLSCCVVVYTFIFYPKFSPGGRLSRGY